MVVFKPDYMNWATSVWMLVQLGLWSRGSSRSVRTKVVQHTDLLQVNSEPRVLLILEVPPLVTSWGLGVDDPSKSKQDTDLLTYWLTTYWLWLADWLNDFFTGGLLVGWFELVWWFCGLLGCCWPPWPPGEADGVLMRLITHLKSWAALVTMLGNEAPWCHRLLLPPCGGGGGLSRWACSDVISSWIVDFCWSCHTLLVCCCTMYLMTGYRRQ
jgi:hypothetical protein